MSNGFLNDIPDLDLPKGGHKKRRRPKPSPEPANVVVYYTRVKCPQCNGLRCPVYNSNHLPVRYHRCLDCGFRFKSVERDIPPKRPAE